MSFVRDSTGGECVVRQRFHWRGVRRSSEIPLAGSASFVRDSTGGVYLHRHESHCWVLRLSKGISMRAVRRSSTVPLGVGEEGRRGLDTLSVPQLCETDVNPDQKQKKKMGRLSASFVPGSTVSAGICQSAV